MKSTMSDQEFDDLCSAVFDGRATEEDVSALEREVLSSAERRRRYAGLASIHAALAWPAGTKEVALHAPQDEELAIESGAERTWWFGRRSTPKTARTRQTEGIGRLGLGLACAAAAIVVVAAWPLLASLIDNAASRREAFVASANDSTGEISEATEDSAILFAAANATFSERALPPLGEALPTGEEIVLVDGLVTLRFPRGAEVTLESPCIFAVDGADRIRIPVGSCSVFAPDGAEGFVVATPAGEVVDLGTRFVVDVGEMGEAELHVVEGAAKVSRHSAPRSRENDNRTDNGRSDQSLLTARQAIRFGEPQSQRPSNRTVTEIPFSPAKYLHQLPDRILSYEATRASVLGDGGESTQAGTVSSIDQLGSGEGVEELVSLNVQRGGRGYRYAVSDLVGVRVRRFVGHAVNKANFIAPEGFSGTLADGLERDRSLVTGLINPAASTKPLEISTFDDELDRVDNIDGLALEFVGGVINSDGPDVVFFDIQSQIDPAAGDSFHVYPFDSNGAKRAISVTKYDIDLTSPQALRIDEFFLEKPRRGSDGSIDTDRVSTNRDYAPSYRFKAIAVGIDLSDLGYDAGENCRGLIFQDDDLDERMIDPVFVAGLPPLAETGH